MRKLINYTSVLIFGFVSLGLKNHIDPNDNNGRLIRIQWTENLKGDFNFRKQWSYPEGVYRNKFEQLSCDGFCPEGADVLMDSDGKIYAGSLVKFYQLVDTTHQFHTIECEAWCYEWAGTDFVKAIQGENNKITCYTLTNSGTHCSLILEITDDFCNPRIELNSIVSPGIKTYNCLGGYIKIDRELWDQKIIKGEFNFDFNNTDNPDQSMFWKGKIYAIIEKK